MQVIVLLLLAASLWGQSQLTLSSPGAQPVTGASTVVVGANRGQNIYYWVVARTPSGYTAPSGVVAFNTVGIANLDSSNYVTISWNAVPLATGYDVIRSSTASYPASTSCASCAVVLNQAGVTFNDQGGALSAYPPGGSLGVTDATGAFTVDDLTEQYPFLNFQMKTGRYDYTTRMTDTRSQLVPCTIVSGTANAIVCNGSAQSPTRPPIGTLTGTGRLATVISLIPGTTNTGATTINPDGLGAVTVQKLSSGSLTALSSGDLVAGVPYLIRYNGTVFVVDPGSGGGSGGGITNPSANGIVVCTGTNCSTSTTRSVTSPDSTLTVTNGDGVAGNVQAVANTAVIATRANVQGGTSISATTGGTSTAYTLALTPTLTAYASGMVITPVFHTACGATPTINVDTLGARKIYKYNGTSAPTQVSANECQAVATALTYSSSLDSGTGGFVLNTGGSSGGTSTWEFPLSTGGCNSATINVPGVFATGGTGISSDCSATRQGAIMFTNSGTPEVHTSLQVPAGFVAGTVTISILAEELSSNSGTACFNVDTAEFTSGGSASPTLTGSPGTVTITSLNGNTRFGTGTVPQGTLVAGDWMDLSISRDNSGACASNVAGNVGIIGVTLKFAN